MKDLSYKGFQIYEKKRIDGLRIYQVYYNTVKASTSTDLIMLHSFIDMNLNIDKSIGGFENAN